jgi:hypothetical protein
MTPRYPSTQRVEVWRIIGALLRVSTRIIQVSVHALYRYAKNTPQVIPKPNTYWYLSVFRPVPF